MVGGGCTECEGEWVAVGVLVCSCRGACERGAAERNSCCVGSRLELSRYGRVMTNVCWERGFSQWNNVEVQSVWSGVPIHSIPFVQVLQLM